jgi:tRNA threonylcarbamoyladenosine biosynthesis protein TsaB
VKLLAVDTATPASSVALGDGSRLAAMAVRVDRRSHVGFVVAALEFCFDRAGWSPHEIDAVVVDVGPGLFTGIRAGLATAQGIAAAVGVPLVPVTALDSLAFRAATGRRQIWSIVDVRKGQVAAASYRPVPGGVVREGAVELVTPDELRAMLDSEARDTLVVGDWESLPETTLRGLHRVKTGSPRYPAADVALELAALRISRGDVPADSGSVRPLYLRDPDAAIGWEEFREEGIWPDSAPR